MFARLAIEDDLDVYIDLVQAAASESAPGFAFDAEKVRDHFGQYIRAAHPTIFVVEQNRAPIAFMHATINDYFFTSGVFTTQEILYVHPDKRGTRAAALLLRAFVDWSDQLGALESTGGNDNALTSDRTRKLLSRFGFETVGFFMRRRGAAHGQKRRH